MTDRATIDRLRGNASGRHKRNAAIADAARALVEEWGTTGRVTQIDIAALAATIERTDRQAAPRAPENLDPYGAQIRHGDTGAKDRA